MDIVLLVVIIVIILVILALYLQLDKSDKFENIFSFDYIDTIPIFIINLKARPNRKKKTQQQLDRFNLKGNFIEAHDGRYLNLDDLEMRGIINRNHEQEPLRRGEIGCYLSHLKCWDLILESNAPYGLVLEDDVIFCDNFRQEFNDIFGNIKDLEWDIISLGRRCQQKWFAQDCEAGLQIYKNAFYADVMGYGAFAYIIKKSTIEKLLATTYPIYKPIDVFICDAQLNGEIKVISFMEDMITVKDIVHSDTINIK